MPPAAQSYNVWMESDSPTLVLDCLLPTGILIPLTVDKDATIADIKDKLWKKAPNYPLFNTLKGKHAYVFQCVTSMAEKVELEDETRPLLEFKPFQPILKVIERKGNKIEKISNLRISMLIGKGLHEFDNLKSTEVSDFRLTMRRVCEKVSWERDSKESMERVRFMYPVNLADKPQFPAHISSKLAERKLTIMVREMDMQSVFTFQVSCTTKPHKLIAMVIDKRKNLTGFNLGETDKYLLKVCGRQEFLLGDYPLSQFMYIRRAVTKGDIPSVVLVEKSKILENDPNMSPVAPGLGKGKPPPRLKPVNLHKGPVKKTLLWDMSEKYSLHLHNATNTNNEDFSKMMLGMCIYHGSDAMCNVEKSTEQMVTQGLVSWDTDVTFDISLQDIPRMARLCFVLFSIKERRAKDKNKREHTGGGKRKPRNKDLKNPVSWVNIPLFDYKDVLRSGPCKLYMWSVTDDDSLSDGEAMLNPIGTVESNPMSHGAVCLSIAFHDYNTSPIHYPPFEQVLEVAAKHTDFSGSKESLLNSNANFSERMSTIMLDESKNVGQQHLEKLRNMVEKDPLSQLCDNEKEKIWMLRYECQHHFPHSLPKLLRCVKWNNHIDVAQVQALLQIWPVLEPDQVLVLLDFDYADKAVRKYAVKCLKNISDQQFSQYLLQFVQVLKYESYLECDLVHFLLERALNNKHIGHRLFWMLRSEMHVQSVSVRFGLILEAYCRGSAHHIEELSKQTIALDKLKTLSVSAKTKSREQAKEDLKTDLSDSKYYDALSDISSTLDPFYKLKFPRIDSCKIMDSKMKPLWLVFENHDSFGDPVYIMYKNGDDLRQDMLTLQMLRIIDDIWQNSGLDLRLNAYGCVSTARSEGLIQIVTGSNTLSNIQKQYAGMKIKAAFNKQSLYEYLRRHNDTDESLQKAIKEFTLSCAGYSVAMYALGVADRHGDNILLKENGQLFHIDFGHFLGHFKSKAGINREPAPFMLTSDFVYVIQRGPAKCHKAFEEFKSTCEKAYMALREKCNFLMSLLLMMMNTGIPELSKVEDIDYLKQTLKPHLNEEEARRHFNKQWNIALKNAWKVAMHNTFHNIMRDNN